MLFIESPPQSLMKIILITNQKIQDIVRPTLKHLSKISNCILEITIYLKKSLVQLYIEISETENPEA